MAPQTAIQTRDPRTDWVVLELTFCELDKIQ